MSRFHSHRFNTVKKPEFKKGRIEMKKTILMLATCVAAATPAAAVELSVVGSWSSLPLHKEYEAPFWRQTLPQASDGKITTNVTTHGEMNLGVAEVFRLLGQGVFDVGMTVGDYAVADAPELEGLDVPLVAISADKARAAVDAARPMVEDIFRDRFNSKVLAIAPYPPQVVFCNKAISNLDDLKGLKVRASGRMTAKFLEALGAEGVNIAFSEVPGALQKGVVDCAVTGAGSGYSAGWWEVSTHLLTIPLGGWDPVVTAINLDTWNELDAETQELIQSEVKSEFEEPAWASAEGALANDVACLTGNGECKSGDNRSMTLVEASDADIAKARNILETQVLPEWADRAGADWAKRWNDSVGKVVDVTVPTD
ncbi:MAG: TRAP transporter substrate-binding protein [Roseitalea porphyridii]